MKYFLYTMIIICLLSACKKKDISVSGKENENTEKMIVRITKAQFDNLKMEDGSLKEQQFDVKIRARGIANVPPNNKAKVSSIVTGSVKDILVRIGDSVQKGQALLIIEGPEIIELQQSYLEICEQLKSLQSDYERQKALYTEKIASEKKFLEAESDYKKAEATCEGLKQQLLLLNINVAKVKQGQISSKVTLYAPIAGDVTMIDADMSKVIHPTDVVVEIVDTKQLQLYLSVFEKDILAVRPGQKVIFTLPEASEKKFTATVKQIGKAIESTNRTVTVQAIPDDTTIQVLLAGMYIDAGIIASSRRVLTLPTDALIMEGKEYFVLLRNSSGESEHVYRKIPVQTGELNGDSIEIIPDGEITPNSVLLIKGVYDVTN